MSRRPDEKLRRPRVLFVSISFAPEPGAIRGLPLARWLRDQAGYEVEALTAVPWYPLGRVYPGYRLRPVQTEWMEGVKVTRVALYPSHDRSSLRRVLTYSSFMASAACFGLPRTRRPDIVYYFDNLPTTGLLASFIARIRGASLVQHIADLWPDSVLESGFAGAGAAGRLATWGLGHWMHHLYRRADGISVLSPGFKRILLERGVPEAKVEVVYNWADEDLFFPATRDPSLCRELGLGDGLNVVYAGNLGRLQALDTVLAAAELLRDDARIRFVIAGSGPDEPRLRDLAARSNLPNVRFIGRLPLDRMNALNSCADVLLVHLKDRPISRATIPSKTQVALASARPVLMGVRGDAATLIEDARAGLTFEPEDASGLASAARHLAELGEEDRERLGRNGREYYVSHMSLAAGAARTQVFFEECLRRRGTRA